jgi:ABC-type Fe3+-siderophore transport system permease subunit
VLGSINLFALIVPVILLMKAEDDPERLIGILAIYFATCLLLIADTVSICIACFRIEVA